MNRLVLIADIPHGAGGHMLLTSSIDEISESYLAPRIRDARLHPRWSKDDAVSVSRESVQQAAGIESNRTVTEVLLLLGPGIGALSESQLAEIFRKLEQRLDDVPALASADVSDRRGSLHLCPQLAGWLLTDDFAPGLGASNARTKENARTTESRQPIVIERSQGGGPGKPLLIGGGLVLASLLAWAGFTGQFQRNAPPETEQPPATANKTLEQSHDPLASQKNTKPVVATDPLDVATADLKALKDKKQSWNESQKEYLRLAAVISDNLSASSSKVDLLRSRFTQSLFDHVEAELSAEVPTETADDITELGTRVATLLQFFNENRRVLQRCLPEDEASDGWESRLNQLGQRAVYVYYSSIRELALQTVLGEDAPISSTLAEIAKVTDQSLSAMFVGTLPPEFGNLEDQFRQIAILDGNKAITRLALAKTMSFVIQSQNDEQPVTSAVFGEPVTNREDRPVRGTNGNRKKISPPSTSKSMEFKIPNAILESPTQSAILNVVAWNFETSKQVQWQGDVADLRLILHHGKNSDPVQLGAPEHDKRPRAPWHLNVKLELTADNQKTFNAAVKWLKDLQKQLDAINPATRKDNRS